MKPAVLGATGRTGIQLVNQALAACHEVVALARTPDSTDSLVHCLKNVYGQEIVLVFEDW